MSDITHSDELVTKQELASFYQSILPYLGGMPSDSYSTDEKIVGTWIDGKPLYQKTVNFGALPNNTTKNVAHGISNLSRVIAINAYAYNPSTSNTRTIPFVGTDTSNSSGTRVYFTTTNISIGVVGDGSAYTECYVTLQYTKTTD